MSSAAEPPSGSRAPIPLDAYNRALSGRIAALPPGPRVAFATACAERLFPAWTSFMTAAGIDDAGLVRRALDRAWATAVGGIDATAGDGPGLVRACVALIPDAEAPSSLPAHAENAIGAAVYSLEAAINQDAEAAAWAASTCMDTLDAFLLPGLPVVSEADEAAVWEHQLVRAEIERREADLVTLAGPDLATAVSAVRARATDVSLLPLDELDHGPPGLPAL